MKIGITERGDAGLDFAWQKTCSTCDGTILITKSLSQRFIHAAAKVNCIVHTTITGLGGSIFEPNVNSWQESAHLFKLLIDTLGAKRVVLRIDPIIPGFQTAAWEVYKALHLDLSDKTRVRISFLDLYPHVALRFKNSGICLKYSSFHAPISIRKSLATSFPDAEVCGEPGFNCTGCISKTDLQILGLEPDLTQKCAQRFICNCLASKTELLGNRKQCPNKCLYCYWH